MEWISVEDHLPEEGQSIDVFQPPNGRLVNILFIDFGFFAKELRVCGSYESFIKKQKHGVTHWMPLPEPPKP